MFRLEDIVTFVEVVGAGSLSGAARRLGVSKSVVSQRLADLEARLNVRLVQRSTRRLGLTDAGASFFERSERILRDLNEAVDMVAERPDDLCGVLRVAVPVSFGVLHAGPAIYEFIRSHPRLDLKLDLDDRMVDLVGAGFDMAIRIGRLPDSSLVARKLAASRQVIVASPAYLERCGTPQTVADLADHDALLYNNLSSPFEWRFDQGASVRVRSRLQINNGDMLRDAAAAGLGLAALPTFLVADAVEKKELVVVKLDREPLSYGVYAVFPQNRHLPQRARALADHLKQAFGDPPYWERNV